MAARTEPRQLALDLPARSALGRAAFLVAPCNEVALAQIDDWRRWPAGKLVLSGPPASGKTHLAHVWAGQTRATIVAAGDMVRADLSALAREAVAVECAESVAGDMEAERALLHLHNLLAAEGRPLLMTARREPGRWDIALPDLASRISAAGVARLSPPDDATLRAVLVKLFDDRQIPVTPSLVEWLAKRIDRSFVEARRVVAQLDAAALAERRRVTRDLAARVLDNRPDAAP